MLLLTAYYSFLKIGADAGHGEKREYPAEKWYKEKSRSPDVQSRNDRSPKHAFLSF
jgi:hypothetical protein